MFLRLGISLFNKIINNIYKAAYDTNATVYLVGGCIRDYLLNRSIYDIDILVYKSSKFLKTIHQYMGGKLICLDNKRQIFRLIFKKKYTVDITNKPKEAIIENLSARDFSINAMAIDIKHVKDEKNIDKFIIDPFNGQKDLKNKIVQIINPYAFKQDPMRLLRAYRISAQLSYKITNKTNCQIKLDRKLLVVSARERIREEWFKLLATPMSSSYIKKMHDLSLLSIIFPEIVELGDLFKQSITTLCFLEKMIADPKDFFNQKKDAILIKKIQLWMEKNKSNLFCIKMAALFQNFGIFSQKILKNNHKYKLYDHSQIGVLIIKKRTKYLRFSQAETNKIAALIDRHHMESLAVYLNKTIDKQKLARFFIATGDSWFDFLLLYIANNWSEVENKKRDQVIEFVKIIINYWEQVEATLKEKPLINGNDLKKYLRCKPGPLMGKILDEIKELTYCGDITSKKEALNMAQYLLINK